MKSSENINGDSSVANSSAPSILVVSAWLGLVCGLVEGAGLVLLQRYELLNWVMRRTGVDNPQLWVSPLFDLVLFLVLAVPLALLGWAAPRPPARTAAIYVFTFLTFLDWALLSGRFRYSACLIFAAGLTVAFGRWWRKREAQIAAWCMKTLPVPAIVALLAFGVVHGGAWWSEHSAIRNLPAAQNAPNVLIVMVDTVRADHLSTFGYGRETDPNLRKLAARGVAFDSAYATSSWTLPSHVSILTGRFPFQHGATIVKYDGRFPMLQSVLAARGYRTGAISANLIYFTAQYGFGTGFHSFEDLYATWRDGVSRTLYGRKYYEVLKPRFGMKQPPWRRNAESITESTLAWIEREPSHPYFLFVNYFDCHDPYLPPQPWRGKFAGGRNVGGLVNTLMDVSDPRLTPEQIQSERDAYDGSIAFTDDQVGRLLGELERRGTLANTLVVFVSDHGEAFAEHGGLFHHRNTLYSEVTQVPMVFVWPGKIPSGVRINRPVTITSIPATIMELLGTAESKDFPAPSLVRLWSDPAAAADWPWPLLELAHMPFRGIERTPAYKGALKALVSPKWYYIVHEKLETQLFDREKDPQQLQNLARSPVGQVVVSDLELRLRETLARTSKDSRPAALGSVK